MCDKVTFLIFRYHRALILAALLGGGCVRPTITEISSELQLLQGKTTSLGPGSVIGVLVVATDSQKHTALLSVTNFQESKSNKGWVEVGHYVDFSPWTGSTGLRLLSVQSNSAVIEMRGALGHP